MRLIGSISFMLAGCVSTAENLPKQPPRATFSSTRPACAVTTCVRDGINTMDWGQCPRATAWALQKYDRTELTVVGERGVDAMLEDRQQGAQSVYELRVSRQAGLGFCSLASLIRAVAQARMQPDASRGHNATPGLRRSARKRTAGAGQVRPYFEGSRVASDNPYATVRNSHARGETI